MPLSAVQSAAIAILEQRKAAIEIRPHTPLIQDGDSFAAGPTVEVAHVTIGPTSWTIPLEALGEDVILAGSSLVALGHVLSELALPA